MDLDSLTQHDLATVGCGLVACYLPWSLRRLVTEIMSAITHLNQRAEEINEVITKLRIQAGISDYVHQRVAEMETLQREHGRIIARLQEGHKECPIYLRRRISPDDEQ